MTTSRAENTAKKVPRIVFPLSYGGIGKRVQKRGLNLWHRQDLLAPTPSVRQPLLETSDRNSIARLAFVKGNCLNVLVLPRSIKVRARLGTLLRTLLYCKTHSRPPSQNPSENPSPEPCPEPSQNPSQNAVLPYAPLGVHPIFEGIFW